MNRAAVVVYGVLYTLVVIVPIWLVAGPVAGIAAVFVTVAVFGVTAVAGFASGLKRDARRRQ